MDTAATTDAALTTATSEEVFKGPISVSHDCMLPRLAFS